jgi:Ca2+-binding EF-hand superfamily protein
MRSPYTNEMQRAEEGEASLVFLTRDAFKEILAIEGHLEVVKKELAIRHDFSLAGVFRKFCDNTHGRINATELLYGLERIGITCDIADARLIIDRYDADKDGRLGFWELSNAFLPIQANLRDEIEMRKCSSNDFTPET